MKTSIENAREIIDSCDKEIAELFEKRFHAVEEVVAYKMENHMQILDSSREVIIIDQNMKRIESDAIRPYFETFYKKMLEVSKEYQKEIMQKSCVDSSESV